MTTEQLSITVTGIRHEAPWVRDCCEKLCEAAEQLYVRDHGPVADERYQLSLAGFFMAIVNLAAADADDHGTGDVTIKIMVTK